MTFVQQNYAFAPLASAEALSMQLRTRLEKGGLAQIVSHEGGSRTWFALTCLGHFLKTTTGDPPLSLWISNEGELYPEALHHYWSVPLSRMLLVQVPTSEIVWQTLLDAVQTGLFHWVLVKTGKSGSPAQMRKLQLSAEKTKTKVLILCQSPLPHWTLKTSVAVPADVSTAKVLGQRSAA